MKLTDAVYVVIATAFLSILLAALLVQLPPPITPQENIGWVDNAMTLYNTIRDIITRPEFIVLFVVIGTLISLLWGRR